MTIGTMTDAEISKTYRGPIMTANGMQVVTRKVRGAGHRCQSRGCRSFAEYRCKWSYVSPRTLRTSHAGRMYCRFHTERFAQQRGLRVPK